MITTELSTCIFCEEPVYADNTRPRFHLAVDRPIYINLLVHRDCYKACKNVDKFLTENLYSYLDKYQEEEKRHGKKKKTPTKFRKESLTN